MTHPDDKFTDEEVATVEQAATDAEARYQARERDLRDFATHQARRFDKISLPAAATAPNAFDPDVIAKIEAENESAIGTAMREIDHQIAEVARELHATGATPDSAPVRRLFSLAGRFRVYFNRHQAAPLVWCIALEGEGLGDRPVLSFEVAVAEVVINSTAGARTVYAPKATPDDEDGRPSAWLEVDGVLRIDPNSSTARIG